MNERIDQLLVKAGAYFGSEGVDYSRFDPKKFAELIVEESFRVALVEGKGYLDPAKLRNAMKKHFGVEE